MKKRTLQLSKHPSVELDLDSLMEPIAILGNRGSGKTYCGQSLFEIAYDAGVQCVAIDVVGKWKALRQKGTGPGLDRVFVFGGKHGDVGVTRESGSLVAQVVANKKIHAVLDLSLMRKGDRRQFLTDFAEEFFLIKKQEDVVTPSLLFLEEAHAVLPQKPQREEARMLGAFEDIAREGRNAGIGLVIMDQRPATVNKDALALVEILIVLRTTWKADREVYEKWVVQKGEDAARINFLHELSFQKAGHGFIYSPAISLLSPVSILPKRTFDASATVKVGGKVGTSAAMSSVNVAELGELMKGAVEEARANDPKILKARIAELEKKTAGYTVSAKPIETKVTIKRELDQLDRQLTLAKALFEKVGHVAENVEGILGNVTGVLKHTTLPMTPAVQALKVKFTESAGWRPSPPAQGRYFGGPTVWKSKKETSTLNSPIGAGPLRMLKVLSAGAPFSKAQLGVLSGYSASGGTFRTYLPLLVREGLIVVNNDEILITPAGLKLTGGLSQTLSIEQLQQQWFNKLGAGPGRMLKELISVYPQGLSPVELGERSGYVHTGGTFRTYLPQLKRLDLVVEEKSTNTLRASEWISK